MHGDDSPFSDHPRSPDGERSPFPRWERRLAEAEALLAWAPVDEDGAEPERER